MSQDGAQGRYAGRAVASSRYQLRDLLGEGGMASVHLAYDSVLDRQVAIKTLHTELGREQAFRERFRREAQAVAKLTHTNIVSVFDTGEDELGGMTTPYIVMEYVEGRPLGSVLDQDIAVRRHARRQGPEDHRGRAGGPGDQPRDGPGPPGHQAGQRDDDEAQRRQGHGLRHRPRHAVRRHLDDADRHGRRHPAVPLPEQALGRGVDARSDLYSVGIMLFQLVTGRLPFEADSPLAIAYAHVQEEPVTPSSINRSLPPAVDALIARALKKNPERAFPSAETMRDECLRVSQSLQAAAPSIVPGARTSSGAGVGSAVFPPVDQAMPAPGPVQTPYQPHPYGAPTPPPAPSRRTGIRRRELDAGGPDVRAPAGHVDPPPYHLTPQPRTSVPGGSGGSRWPQGQQGGRRRLDRGRARRDRRSDHRPRAEQQRRRRPPGRRRQQPLGVRGRGAQGSGHVEDDRQGEVHVSAGVVQRPEQDQDPTSSTRT